jgi:hypothetical protein
MRISFLLLIIILMVSACDRGRQTTDDYARISLVELEDKIQGGLLGEILGNLNGLPYEFKFYNDPGEVEAYIPALPYGGYTDDDTDIEWVHIFQMQKKDTLFLSPDQIVEAWKENMNKKVYASAYYIRQLMDIGIKPPQTGYQLFNPFSHFSLAGSYLSEAYGLISPGMPQTAAQIGTHYTSIQVEGESLQVTQLVTSMISIAFFIDDVEEIINKGIHALDPLSDLYHTIDSVRTWYRCYPDDYLQTRKQIKNHYYTSSFPDKINDVSYRVNMTNTACVVAGLLYGQGDFTETLRIIFNLGWDADCNAATAGTIIGVIKGRSWMLDQGWDISDQYWNDTRDGMPQDETITSYGDRLVSLAEKIILRNGGEIEETEDGSICKIRTEEVKNREKLKHSMDHLGELKLSMKDSIIEQIRDDKGGTEEWARGAYYALCLELPKDLENDFPVEWERAIKSLDQYPRLLYAMLYPKYRLAFRIRELAMASGIDMVNIEPSLTGNVEFHLDDTYPEAESIAVYGDFTHYSKFETIFGRESGQWICRVDLKPGRYNYQFIVRNKDGTQQYIFDPHNKVKGRHIDGHYYSMLDVGQTP